jgi:hypothetical protein
MSSLMRSRDPDKSGYGYDRVYFGSHRPRR